jgi:hypothetical protein
MMRNNPKSGSGRIISNTFPNFLLKSDITVRHSVVSLPINSALHWQVNRSQHRNQVTFSSMADNPGAGHPAAFGQLIDMPVHRFALPHVSRQT